VNFHLACQEAAESQEKEDREDDPRQHQCTALEVMEMLVGGNALQFLLRPITGPSVLLLFRNKSQENKSNHVMIGINPNHLYLRVRNAKVVKVRTLLHLLSKLQKL